MKKISTRTIVYGAFFVAIALLLGGGIQRVTGIPVSIDLNIGGAKQSIDLTVIPLAMSGIILGPVGAFMVGFVYDNLGFLLFKGGVAYNPIFTIADIMIALVPALIYMYLRKRKVTYSISKIVMCLLAVYGIFAVLFTSVLSTGGSKGQKLFQIVSFENGFEIVNWGLLIGVLTAIIISELIFYILNKRHIKDGYYSFEKLYIAIFLGTLIRSMISGFGLYSMQVTAVGSIPLVYYLVTRLITPLVVVPIVTTILMAFTHVFNKYSSRIN